MQISTSQFKTGIALVIDGQLFIIEEFQHVKPGKGSAFVRTKLRNVRVGTVIPRTFDSGDKFEEAFIETKDLQYTYRAASIYHFMDLKSYDELSFNQEELGSAVNYLLENLQVRGDFHNGRLVGLELPTTVELAVAQADPGLRGDTSKGGTKPVTLETGLVIQAPLFIETGEKLKVDTRTGEYVGRA
ncbi:MAG: elongation factor P [Candidatus Omnitrophica bacterium]|nr:elongation factor P [Candidatus Omnitrophota bacterium]